MIPNVQKTKDMTIQLCKMCDYACGRVGPGPPLPSESGVPEMQMAQGCVQIYARGSWLVAQRSSGRREVPARPRAQRWPEGGEGSSGFTSDGSSQPWLPRVRASSESFVLLEAPPLPKPWSYQALRGFWVPRGSGTSSALREPPGLARWPGPWEG